MRNEAGLVIGKRFRLLGLVDAGAFGSVWRAADRVPGKQVAIRIISDGALGAEALDAFRSDMMIASTVRHRSLASIYAAGRDPSGAVWVASELVDGESLESALQRQPPSVVQTLTMIAELAGALAELHTLGLSHSAVSARTVLLVPRSGNDAMRPALIGLGRARLLGAKRPTLDVAYSSPEALASNQYDPAADIWSLGVLLFRCVSGRLPFAARTAAAMQVETRRLTRLLSTIEDPSVRLLIAECFALDPAQRPDASDLARRALNLAAEMDEEEPTAIFSRPEELVRDEPEPVEGAPATTPSSLAPIEISTTPEVQQPSPVVEATPPRDSDLDVPVEFRPSRGRAKFLIGAAAAAAIFAELIVGTREPRPTPSAAAHVAPEQPAVVLTPPAPTPTEVAVTSAPEPTAVASASASFAPEKSPPKPRPAAASKPVAPPVKTAGDENPYK